MSIEENIDSLQKSLTAIKHDYVHKIRDQVDTKEELEAIQAVEFDILEMNYHLERLSLLIQRRK